MKKKACASNLVASMSSLPPQRCPCGFTRRAFANVAAGKATVHMVEIMEDSQTHYHKRLTEIYYVLEGEGEIELDGQRFPLKPHTAVLLPPNVRHRAIGKLKILNFVTPKFDPKDEHFD